MGKTCKIIVVVLLNLCGFPLIAGAQQAKIGFVDTSKVMEECDIGKQARAQLAAEIKQSEREIEKRRQKITRLQSTLEKPYRRPLLYHRENLERQYRQSLRDFERSYREAQEQLKIRDQELTDALLVLINDLLTETGNRDEYTVILQGNDDVILYGAESINITDQLIAICDKKSRESSLKRADVQEIVNKELMVLPR